MATLPTVRELEATLKKDKEKPRYKSSYTGPVSNRQIINGKAVVSKEELADFKRQFGKDMTLRDLLNMDKDEFALERQAKSRGAYRGMRSEEPAKKEPAKKEEDSGMMSRLRRAGLTAKGAEEAGGLSSSAMAALGMAGGALGRGAKASKTASMARTEPRVGRPVTSRLDDAEAAFSRPQARQVSKDTGYTREPLPEKKMPKERTQFRSRTADRRDEREMRMAKGGVAKKRK